jgi:hypothetical protein
MRSEALTTFYLRVAPWLEMGGNDSFLQAEAVEDIVELAKGSNGPAVRQEYLAEYPELRTTAGRNLALDRALEQYLEKERQSLVLELGGKVSDYTTFSNAELRALCDETAERNQLQAEITRGQSMFSMKQNGVTQRFDSATGQKIVGGRDGRPRIESNENWFQTVDIETLRAVHAQIVQERDWKENTDSSELKKIIRDQRPGYSAPLPNTKPVDTLTADGYQLINPNTLTEFTKPQLLAFLDVKGNAARILVHTDSKKINSRAVARMREILQGR